MEQTWRIVQGVGTTEDAGSLLLLSPDGVYYGLEDVGVKLWRGLEQDSLETTLEALSTTYNVEIDVLQKDAQTLFSELERAGLLERA